MHFGLVLLAALAVLDGAQASPFEEVHELLTFGEQLTVPERDLVVLLSSRGVDKAVLVRFVVQDEGLKVRRRGSRLYFEAARGANRSRFQDALPHFFRDRATGQVLLDVPGFSESREPRLDVAAAFFTKRVLDQALGLKIVLVENHANLMEGADPAAFHKLLRHVARLVPDVARFRQALGLVVAKVHAEQQPDDGQVLENVLNQVAAFRDDLLGLAETQFEFSEEHNETQGMLRVLDTIYANGTAENLALFRRPDEEGSPWGSDLMLRSQQELRVLFFGSLAFCPVAADSTFPYAISLRSRDFVAHNLIPTNNQMASHYLSKVFKELLECVEKGVKSKSLIGEKAEFLAAAAQRFSHLVEGSDLFLSLSGVATLKQRLAAVCSAWHNSDLAILQNILKSTELTHDLAATSLAPFLRQVKAIAAEKAQIVQQMHYFYTFAQTLNAELQSYHVQVARKTAHLQVTAANFKEFIFNLSKFNIQVAHKEKVIGLEPSKKMLSDLNAVLSLNLNHTTRRSFSNFGQELVFEGRTLILSEILAELPKFQNLQNLFLFAYKGIFLDADLSLVDVHLSMAAPQVIVIGENRTFHLTGSEGLSEKVAANASSEGRPGGSGGDAGNLLILSLEVVGADHLSIKSQGGGGGNGQDGGPGRDGRKVASPHLEDVYPEFVNGVASWEKVKGHGYILEHPDVKTLVLVNRQGAAPPTKGGHGGAGGSGGRAGDTLVLTEKGSGRQPQVAAVDGADGRHGEGGKGGRGSHLCARKVFKGPCKTKHCEILNEPKNCKCEFHSFEFCEAAPDAQDGVSGLAKGQEGGAKATFDWLDVEAKMNGSVLANEGLQVRENATDLKFFLTYARSTLKTLAQAFRGMHSSRCRP